jgi:hypothetical protein
LGEEFRVDVEVDHFRYLVIANAKAHVRLDKSQFSTGRGVRFPVPKMNFIEGVKKILDVLALGFSNSTDT